MKNISIIISNKEHPVFSEVLKWSLQQNTLDIEVVNSVSELREEGDFLFLVSCSEIINVTVRSRFKHCLVLHASDLPKGRGWSPHVWDILHGADTLTLSLIEAEDKVDTGKIWLKERIHLDGTELYKEINHKLFKAEINLIDKAINRCRSITPVEQSNIHTINYHPKRTKSDGELDKNKTIMEQFNLLRVSDNDRYPAFIKIHGQKYTVKLEKVANSENEP